jgi:type IV secretion system protein TrbG
MKYFVIAFMLSTAASNAYAAQPVLKSLVTSPPKAAVSTPRAASPAQSATTPKPSVRAPEVSTHKRRPAYHTRSHRAVKKTRRPGPTSQVDRANHAAMREPGSFGFLGAVQVYPWSEGALYRLYAAPEQVSDIALQPGENLIAVAAGDIVRWIIGDTVSGSGVTKQTHILVKPSAPGLKTNLVITTSTRVYHLALESTRRTAMSAISWTYPQDALIALQRRIAESEAATPVATGVMLENLHFGYVISGDSPTWRPIRAFDDGTQVMIEFPASLGTSEAPPLFVVGANGTSQLVNYRVRANYYIVDRMFEAVELRLGEKPQSVVRITRSDKAKRSAKRQKGAGQ